MQKKNAYRIEKDIFGAVEIPTDRYWGTQTQRSLKKFRMGNEKFPESVIASFGLQKKCATLANLSLGLLEKKIAKAIIQTADEIIKGKFNRDFPLVIWQTGSGTQTNMNCNEVMANRSNQILGGDLGARFPVHPNDHVNLCQSSNDTFPTVMQITLFQQIDDVLMPALQYLRTVLLNKAKKWKKVITIGRTHLMDALPIPLSQEFHVYEQQILHNMERIEDVKKRLLALPQGGTAVGTGFNSHPHFAEQFIRHLRKLSKTPYVSAQIKNEGMASQDVFLEFSGALNVLAASLVKLCNDIRLLSSGPRCGIAEYFLPIDGLTSSSMPGKITATDAEALLQVCYQVMGNHVTVTLAAAGGNFELNNFKPVILYNVLHSLTLLAQGMLCLADNCLKKLILNRKKINQMLTESLSLATALTHHIGYDNTGKIVLQAMRDGITLKEAALKLKLLSEEEYKRWVNPAAMIHPRLHKKEKKKK